MKVKFFLLTVATCTCAWAQKAPEAKDVQGEIIQAYAVCDAVALSDFEKIDSIKRADHYSVELAWKFTVRRDVEYGKMMLTNGQGLCKNQAFTRLLLAQLVDAGVTIQDGIERGDVIGAANTFKVVKSEKGWRID